MIQLLKLDPSEELNKNNSKKNNMESFIENYALLSNNYTFFMTNIFKILNTKYKILK